MGCRFCGGGDGWIKICRAPDGSRLRVCDPCYGPKASELVIVPGDRVVTARCDRCGVYANPREFAEVRPGGRHGAFSGTCGPCAGEGVGGSRTELLRNGGER